MIIAIDGPAGTGKGTISKLLSERLGYVYIDTGAMYRAITLKVIREKISLDDENGIKKLLDNTNLDFDDNQHILLDGEDVSGKIRTQEVNNLVSLVSSIVIIREKLVEQQRNLGSSKNIVMEGRDITTVVFPNAEVKIYLTATLEERVQRRYKEMLDKGMEVSYNEVYQTIQERDEMDMHKKVGALKIAPDANVVDSTGKSIEEVYKEILQYVKMKGE